MSLASTEEEDYRLHIPNIYQEKVGFARKISLNGSSEDEFSLDVDLSKLKEKQGKPNQLYVIFHFRN